ncbi:MAG: ferrochelatase [Candidatus Zixiibacteriota bacterium]
MPRSQGQSNSESIKDRAAVILLSMGGPDRLEDIRRYLFNIFSDRSIIRLPGGKLLQKPFASLISRLRMKTVQDHYRLIGGGSPLLFWTETQARMVESTLKAEGIDCRCYVGMRYFEPTIERSIEKALSDGCRKFCLLPLYPQYSSATTGSSFAVAAEGLSRSPQIESEFIDDFHDHAGYISLLKRYIDDNIGANERLFFSAHSLPQRFVDDGDPYVQQVYRTASLAAGDREYTVAFQSRTGPVQWVGPDTVDEVRRLLDESSAGLFVVPISFVCDHIETLHEIDIQLKDQMVKNGYRIRRMPMFNDDPAFADVLASLVQERLCRHVTC